MTEIYKNRNFEKDYEIIEEELRNEMNLEKKTKQKRAKKSAGKMVFLSMVFLIIIALAGSYIWGVVYFNERFFFNTEVNGVDFSRQTVTDAIHYIEGRSNNFYLLVHSNNGEGEYIYAHEIGLTFTTDSVIDVLLHNQNAFLWPLSLIRNNATDASFEVEFDELMLHARVQNLAVVVDGNTESVDASVVIESGYAVVVPQIYGDVVKVDELSLQIANSILNLETTFYASGSELFYQPTITTSSAQIVDALANLNHYLYTEITFLVGDEIVLDRHYIADWLSMSDDFEVYLDERQIAYWFNDFVPRVNTHGTTRSLYTPEGREVEVTGGYYGWIISRDLEFAQLLENVRNGDVISREPIFFQRAESFEEQDWGETFIQVDLTYQHMWFILEGEVIFDAPVITGLPQGNRATPQGVYFILDTLSPTVLIGATDPVTGLPIYETPVDYWMRTTWSGHGFHDATWQVHGFGGTLYRTHGSHGCTNLSLEDARELYNLIHTHWPVMMPVVVHY